MALGVDELLVFGRHGGAEESMASGDEAGCWLKGVWSNWLGRQMVVRVILLSAQYIAPGAVGEHSFCDAQVLGAI